jgi:hypothetical protein
MKKQYLKISLTAFFFAALIFGTSCSKKSSDPAPATPTPTPPVATSTKPTTAPNTTDKKSTNQTQDGTLRPPTTSISVTTSSGATVDILDQNQQRNNVSSENSIKLDNLTGKSPSQQGRLESGTTDYGWYISEMTVDGVPYSDQKIKDDGFERILFFNLDESAGYYWVYDYKTTSWYWGTYGVDKNVSYLALDIDDKGVPNELWQVTNVTPNRMVLTGKVNIDNDAALEEVVIGLNGYDLSNSNYYNGEIKTSEEEKVFLGNWNLQLYINNLTGQTLTNIPFKINVMQDGTWQSQNSSINDYGSWVIEPIQGGSSQGTGISYFYLYASSYDAETSSIVVEKHLVYIENEEMVMILQDTSDPNDQDSKGDQYYFIR